MTLRSRLALVLGVLVLVPLVAAAVLVVYAVPRATNDRADSLVVATRSSVVAALATRCERTAVAARSVGRDTAAVTPQAATNAAVSDGLVDWAAVVATSGRFVGESGKLPADAPARALGDCQQGTSTGPVVAAQVELAVAGQPKLRSANAASSVDAAYLDTLRSTLGFTGDIALLLGGKVVVGTSSPHVDMSQSPELVRLASGEDLLTHADGITSAVAKSRPGMPFDVVVAIATPSSALLVQSVFLVVLVAVIVAVVVAMVVARDMTEPLEEVTHAAEAVAAGDLTRSIDVHRDDEVGRLARAFNHMTGELQTYVRALEGSRDALRANLGRLGEALSATHDLETLLPVVLETAMSSVGANAGLVLLGDEHGGLTVQVEHGMRTRGLKVPDGVAVGEGLLGSVAASGLTVRGIVGSTDELMAAPNEPQTGEVLAVPLRRSPHVFGVIALFAPIEGTSFTEAEESALLALAGQAAIAVENVMLHGEAQRASTTDSLTGLWNLRYLTVSLNREIERALRFDRSLAVLMLDLDLFKNVNDTYGHQRGDSVLKEFAGRVKAEIREVDTLARYGGEEFVLVLPETTAAGASRLADRICQAIRARSFGEGEDDPPIEVTVSIGAAVFPEHADGASTLLRAADRALYAAKRAGRDRWLVAEPTT
ncbi:MAG TPA: diguanylate cyclase [Actinomycetes bacterium]|nr:diguanylate cyclase [Actinomycetes bacterium]